MRLALAHLGLLVLLTTSPRLAVQFVLQTLPVEGVLQVLSRLLVGEGAQGLLVEQAPTAALCSGFRALRLACLLLVWPRKVA